jgi:hypothetical protein
VTDSASLGDSSQPTKVDLVGRLGGKVRERRLISGRRNVHEDDLISKRYNCFSKPGAPRARINSFVTSGHAPQAAGEGDILLRQVGALSLCTRRPLCTFASIETKIVPGTSSLSVKANTRGPLTWSP